MDKTLFISNFRKFPKILFLSLLVFFVAQLALQNSQSFWKFCYLYSSPGTDDGLRLEAKLKAVPKVSPKTKVFLVGSSQTREDYDIDFLNSSSGKADVIYYNFGMSGASQMIDVYMIRKILIAKKPDIIVFMPFIATFYEDYLYNKMHFYFHHSILPHLFRHFGFKGLFEYRIALVNSLLGEMSFLFKFRESFRRIFITAVKVKLENKKRILPKKYVYHEVKPDTYFDETVRDLKGRKYYDSKYSKLFHELFILFSEEVVSNDIKLIVITGPTNPRIKETYPRRFDQAYERFLSEQSKRIGFNYLTSKDLPKFTKDDFIDFLHLSKNGRQKFSEFMKELIESALPQK